MRLLLELAHFNVDDFVHLAYGMNRRAGTTWGLMHGMSLTPLSYARRVEPSEN